MIHLKSKEELKIMAEGGRILNQVMDKLLDALDEGIEMKQLDSLAESEIKKRGAQPSFKMVPGYHWSICACVNDIVVHGIPTSYKAKIDDLIGIDMGVFYKGFHTDSSWSVRVGGSSTELAKKIDNFLLVGRNALDKAIDTAFIGNHIHDISRVIETTVKNAGFSVVKSLIGHGVGKNLHEEPEIPGFIS